MIYHWVKIYYLAFLHQKNSQQLFADQFYYSYLYTLEIIIPITNIAARYPLFLSFFRFCLRPRFLQSSKQEEEFSSSTRYRKVALVTMVEILSDGASIILLDRITQDKIYCNIFYSKMYQNHRYTLQQKTVTQKPHSITYTSNNTPIQIQNLYGSEALPPYRNRIYTSPNNSHALENQHQNPNYAANNYYHAQQAVATHSHYAVNHTVVLPPGMIANPNKSYNQISQYRSNETVHDLSRFNKRQQEYMAGKRYHTPEIGGHRYLKEQYDMQNHDSYGQTQVNQQQYHQNRIQRHHSPQAVKNIQYAEGHYVDNPAIQQNNVFLQRNQSPTAEGRHVQRQNYHMAGVFSNSHAQNISNSYNHQYVQYPIKASSPIAAQSRKTEIKRLSPAFQYNPEASIKINFRYNTQNVIYQPQPIPVVYQPPQQIITHHTNTVTTTVTVWQHHFVEIYMRFESFVERFQSIIEEFLIIQELFDNVSDEEGWTELRTRYNNLMEKFATIREESIMVIQSNRQVVDKLSEETLQYYREKQQGEQYQENIQEQKPQSGGGSSGNEQINPQPQPVQEYEQEQQQQVNWQQRYYEVVEEYQSLKQQYQALYTQLENVSRILQQQQQQQQQEPQADKDTINRNSQLQKNYNILQNQYQNLQQNFHKISFDYNEVIKEIQNFQQVEQQYQQEIMKLQQENNRQMPNQEQIQNMVNQYDQQLQAAGERIEYLEQQLNNQQQFKNQNAEVQHNQAYENRIEELLEEKNHMIETINQMHEELQHLEAQVQHYQNNPPQQNIQPQQNNHQFQEFESHIMKYQQELQQKERFIQQISSSYQNLQVQIEDMERNNNKNSEREQFINQIESLNCKIEILEKTVEFKSREIAENQARINSLKDQYLGKMEEYRRKEKEFHKKQLENSRTLSVQEQSKMNQRIQELQRDLLEKTMELQNIQEQTKIIISETRNSNTKKITIFQQQINEYKETVEKMRKDKEKAINKIKEYFYEETSGYDKKITEKDDMIRLLNEKIRAFEKQLASRNLEISRFRYQSNNTSFGTNSNNEQIRKINEVLQRKNAELQQVKKSIEQKILAIKELEQKVQSQQQQISNQIFENNNLKREVFEIHNCKAEIESLNTNLKKKNQQISELRLSTLENDQLKVTIDSLERQKIRHAEYLKERDREISAKNSKISEMEKKINTLLLEQGKLSTNSSPANHIHSSFSANYENLLKQKESENKKLQYELEVQVISLQSKQKSIRDLNERISSLQQSYSLLKAQSENKYVKLQGNSKDYQKRCYELENQNNELTNTKQLLEHKIRSLEKSQEDGMKMFDKEIKATKNKLSAMEEKYTQLTTEYELYKNTSKIIEQENNQLKNKVEQLQKRIDDKNQSIESLKMATLKGSQDYEKQLEKSRKQLESRLEQEKIRSRSLEENIKKLQNKLKEVEIEKRSYKEKLYTEYSHSQEFAENRFYTEQGDGNRPHHTRISEAMDKFKIKDTEANDVFQRKVIYDLKRENDLLRRQLSGLGASSFSMNRFQSMNQQQQQQSIYESMTDRMAMRASEQAPVEDPTLEFHKQKNKELEIRIQELLSINKALKDKLSGYGPSSQLPQETVQFYKSQIQSLELLNKNLSNKHNILINQNYTLKEEQLEYESEIKSMKAKIAQLENQIRDSKGKNKESQHLQKQIENLKNMLNEEKKEAKNLYAKYKSKQEELGSELAKEKSKNSSLSSELQRLKQLLKLNEASHTEKISTSESELQELRNTARQLTTRVRQLQQELANRDGAASRDDLRYKIEKLRSIYLAIEALAGEISVRRSEASRDGAIITNMRGNVEEALSVMQTIQV